MTQKLKAAWQQLRWYPQGCTFEDDYRFIRATALVWGTK